MAKKLSVNVDHVATLREARHEKFPDPVHAALAAESAGADGITVHLRADRRHIQERDLRLLRATVAGELNLEMAATEPMLAVALDVKPDVVSIVPETEDEVTTEGGLDLKSNLSRLRPVADALRGAGITVSVFIEAEPVQVAAAQELGARRIEINTNRYACDPARRPDILRAVDDAAKTARRAGLDVHAGHGLDVRNIEPVARIPEVSGFSIGFSIVARSLLVGFDRAVSEMKHLLARYS